MITMKIIACCKIVPNEEEIRIQPDRQLSTADASLKISQYDLNALETGKQLAAEANGTMTALSVGPDTALTNSKIRKDILSRGADELNLVQDDSLAASDSLRTARVIAGALKLMEYDLVLCGAGSSDLYAQQVGIQTGTLLGIPVINNVTAIKEVSETRLVVERTLEDGLEVLAIPLPAVVSVSSEINVPSVPSMRDIMKAGKKPVTEMAVAVEEDGSTQVLEQLAPAQQDRRQEMIEGDGEEAVRALVSFLKKEGF